MKSKTHYGVQCPDCEKRVFSHFTHDYKTCGCLNNTMIDGGYSYMRYGGVKMPKRIRWSVKKDGVLPTIKDKSGFPY